MNFSVKLCDAAFIVTNISSSNNNNNNNGSIQDFNLGGIKPLPH